ncbi:MAG: tRNA lysidine(34) synthetase TilS, partial [Bacillota bacterium]
KEIEEYIKNNHLATVEDCSNYDKKYFRNQVRLEIIPNLKEYNPNLVAGLVKGGEIFRGEDLYLEQLTEKFFQENCLFESAEVLSVSYQAYREQPLAIKRRFLRKCFLKLVDSGREMGFDEVERVVTWLAGPVPGKLLEWPAGIKIKYSQGRIIIGSFSSDVAADNEADFQLAVPKLGQTEINSDLFQAELVKIGVAELLKKGDPWTVFVDADRVSFPLIIRNRRAGDRFYPLGMEGSKKLKDFFIDLKIPRAERAEILMVTSLEGEIIWVMGLRIDERYRVTGATKRILKLSLIKTIINSKLV